MRAGLGGDVHAARAGLGGQGDATRGAEVHEMQRRAGLLGEEDRAAHRLGLRDRRARREVVPHARAALLASHLRQRAGERVALGVRGDDQPGTPRGAHALEQRHVVCGRELVQATVTHERLEADHAARRQLVQFREVQRRQAAPQAEIQARLRLAVRAFLREGPRVQQRRRGIQRHVQEARRAACRQRARTGLEALPVGAARFVQVHVGVHHAGEDVQPGRVDLLAGGREHVQREAHDPPVLHGQIGADRPVRGHERSTPDQQVERHQRAPSRSASARTNATPTRSAASTSSGFTVSSGW